MSGKPTQLIPTQTIDDIEGTACDSFHNSISVQVIGSNINGNTTRKVYLQQSNDATNWATIEGFDDIEIPANGSTFHLITDFYAKWLRAVVIKGNSTQGDITVIAYSR